MIKITDVLAVVKALDFIGDKESIIKDVIQLDVNNSRDDVIFWCSDKNMDKLKYCEKGTIICSEKAKANLTAIKGCNYIIVENPRLTFSLIVNSFFVPQPPPSIVSANAMIHPSARIGKNVFIGDFTVIESGCVIGDNCYIGYANVLHQNTHIGNNVKIGSNNTIGGIGFGYEKNESNQYELLPHIGNVVIHDKVEIGNNTCIDRAVLGSTRIEENVKIDNLVHIAHGVVVKRNSLVIAHAMIGGSAEIGENSWISPGALVINKGSVGNNALVGMGAVVIKPVEDNSVVAGNPARFLKKI